jgi:hypothetical protein
MRLSEFAASPGPHSKLKYLLELRDPISPMLEQKSRKLGLSRHGSPSQIGSPVPCQIPQLRWSVSSLYGWPANQATDHRVSLPSGKGGGTAALCLGAARRNPRTSSYDRNGWRPVRRQSSPSLRWSKLLPLSVLPTRAARWPLIPGAAKSKSFPFYKSDSFSTLVLNLRLVPLDLITVDILRNRKRE